MRGSVIVTLVTFTLVAGFGALQLTAQSATTGAPVVASPPAPHRTVALGRLEPISEVLRVSGPAGQDAARLAEVRVAEGDWVERGQIVALLDTRGRLLAALAQAEATLDLRRAVLARTRADLESQERTLAASVEQQQAQRDSARWELERLQTLQRSGLYRETALIDRRLALESAEQVLAGARLALQRNRVRDERGLRLEEASAVAEQNAAEAAVRRARADLAMAEILAPISGRVLRRIGRNGEQISSDGIVEIGDTRVMVARVEVFEADVDDVVLGQAVTITGRAFSGAANGRVERIGLKVNRQSVIGEDPATALDARVVEVMVRLDEAWSARVSGFTGLQVRATFAAREGS
jgi:HlyD family secretion protein